MIKPRFINVEIKLSRFKDNTGVLQIRLGDIICVEVLFRRKLKHKREMPKGMRLLYTT